MDKYLFLTEEADLKPLDMSDNAPWKQRFRAAEILYATLAPQQPTRGMVLSNRDGVFQLYGWDVASGDLRQLTFKPTGLLSGMLSADGRYVYYLMDAEGNEIGHYVRVPFEGGEPQDITPDMTPYASFRITQSHSGRVTGFMAAGPAGFEVYVIEGEGSPRRIASYKALTFGPGLSYDGEIAVIDTSERSGTLDTTLMAVDTRTGEVIAELCDGDGIKHNFGDFSPLPGDMRLLATSNRTGYDRPLIWNPRTGERTDLKLDNIPGEVTGWSWTSDGKQVLLGQLYQAVHQLYLYDLATDTAHKLNHPSGIYGSYFGNAFFAPDGDIYAPWEDSTHPSSLVALDAQTGAMKRVVLAAGSAPDGQKFRSISFTGARGDTIQAWLATPEGTGPFPTIVETHGGPTAVQMERFSPLAQTWLDHGFAFVSINYHGSTTFGKDFERSIWGNLGHLEAEDVAAAVRWLIDNGIAQADSILKTGGSYGGYMTLMSIGKYPELWAGGMAQIAIADWELMYEDQAETLRGYQRALFGGTPQEKPEAHRASSPITYAEQIKAPLLVIQGSNDTRCPPRQMRAYEAKLKSLGKSIQMEWFEAGHGSLDTNQLIHHQEVMLNFAYRVLG